MADGDDGVVSPWGLLHLESFWNPYQNLGVFFLFFLKQFVTGPDVFFWGDVIQLDKLADFLRLWSG